MEKERSKRSSPPGGAMTAAIALLLVVCLAECATEQRINSRGSKASKVFEKVNGWRSQRGGSCLSYGHSCWGAHGKRSGKPPAAAPDWFLDKLFRRIDTANSDLHRSQTRNDDTNAIYERDGSIASLLGQDRADSLENGGIPMEIAMNRDPEAKPMLDDELLHKIKLWEKMREAAEE